MSFPTSVTFLLSRIVRRTVRNYFSRSRCLSPCHESALLLGLSETQRAHEHLLILLPIQILDVPLIQRPVFASSLRLHHTEMDVEHCHDLFVTVGR